MQKLAFPGSRSLDKLKSTSVSISRSANTFVLPSRSDSLSVGSFANLKITAEKLVKEQASVKTDLDLTNQKLKKSIDHIQHLEEKLQNAFNENAKLKVKQKEDEKLWKGLESKFSSTKTLCDQLTETLHTLASQVQNAENDKVIIEGKICASSTALESLHQQMKCLSSKLEFTEETVRDRDVKLKEIKAEKEEMEKLYIEENTRTSKLIEVRDEAIKLLEASMAASRVTIESLNNKLEELHLILRSKEEHLDGLRTSHDNLEKEKNNLIDSNKEVSSKLEEALCEIKKLEDLVHFSSESLLHLNDKSMAASEMVIQLCCMYESWIELLHRERNLITRRASKQYEKLHVQYISSVSEKDALLSTNQDLNNKVGELQKLQEFAIVKHTEERHLAEERIQKMESELEMLVLERNELVKLAHELEEEKGCLLEKSKLSEDKMKELLLKFSALENEKISIMEKAQTQMREKAEEIDNLQKDIEKNKQCAESLELQVSQLQHVVEEKEKLIQQHKDEEKLLEDKKSEIQGLLAATENKLVEEKKQYVIMLESKQTELSRHLKEISQRNDQAINDMRKKYEVEKMELVNLEKEKAEKNMREIETKCEHKLAELREESNQCLIRVKDEQVALIASIKEDHEKKELCLRNEHEETLKRLQLKTENELREKITLVRNEHEVQLKALRCQHTDELHKLQEELDVQKSKEERQRALLQLQWRVMDDKPQEDQEVTSKKGSAFLRGSQTPLLTKMDKVGDVMKIPKHSKKVTHHEYEVETSNGKTITKRRKTKSTVMYEDPAKHKKMRSPRIKTPKSIVKGAKEVNPQLHSNIGDLFTEGSLNPYVDDPYAFD